MNTLERKYVFTLKQYNKEGFGGSYCFVDAYQNDRLISSVMLGQTLSDNELERFFNVFLARLSKGNAVDFWDSTEKRMDQLLSKSQYRLSELERTLASKMGAERFETHYERKCYYLMFLSKEAGREVQETFHVSDTCPPLTCLKMAHRFGKMQGTAYRILLSDKITEVDPELLAFALSEK